MAEWEEVPQHRLDLRRYVWNPDSVCRKCGERIREEEFYSGGRRCTKCERRIKPSTRSDVEPRRPPMNRKA